MSSHFQLLIEADQLKTIQQECIILDCRHDLFNHDAGAADYASSHIEGAQFCNMETDTAGAHTGTNGRHPLPSREAWRDRLAAFGLHTNQQLVAYDAHGGQFAVRVWWMARWIGHSHVAVLNGGLPAWIAASGTVQSNLLTGAAGTVKPGNICIQSSLSHHIDADQLALNLAAKSSILIDARAQVRYAGETEPIDPVAGHIPGAVNHFYQHNLNADGRFKSADLLRAQFESLIKQTPPVQVIHQCGSGVTACHNILAMELAGMTGSSLYPGSWSEWCSDTARGVQKGAMP